MRNLKFLVAIAALLFSHNAHTALSELDRSLIPARNLLSNPGFEAGLAGWTASGGTYTTSSTAANVGSGNSAGSWDASAAAQTFTSSAVAIPAGLYGRNGVASCLIKGSGATHKLQAFDGTNVLAETTITSLSSYARTSVNFVFPSSANVQLRLSAVASNEPLIYVDDCIVADAMGVNLSQVNQASVYGSVSQAATASCTWTTTSTSFGNFAAVANCPTPTVSGNATAPSTKIPGITFPSLPPGDYMVMVNGVFHDATGDANQCYYRLTDGTTNSFENQAWANTLVSIMPMGLTRKFSYTTAQSNVTFQIQAKSDNATNTCAVRAVESGFSIDVIRLPSSSELAVRPDQTPASWSGYHDSTCAWARTNTAYGDPTADTTCTLTERNNRNFGTVTSYLSGADKLPGIVFTPTRPGRYFVCAVTHFDNGTVATGNGLELSDTNGTVIAEQYSQQFVAGYTQGHTLCGIYNAASVASTTLRIRTLSTSGTLTLGNVSTRPAIEWSITQLDAGMSNPVIVGQVSSNTSGQERVERARITCSSSAAVQSQSGSWISSVGNVSSGVCTLTIAAGTFSSTPSCVHILKNATTLGGSYALNVVSTSATSIGLGCYYVTGSSNCVGFESEVLCMGPR